MFLVLSSAPSAVLAPAKRFRGDCDQVSGTRLSELTTHSTINGPSYRCPPSPGVRVQFVARSTKLLLRLIDPRLFECKSSEVRVVYKRLNSTAR
jgi:hypothetical protein